MNKQPYSMTVPEGDRLEPTARRRTTVFIISAPSGSGKSTLVARLLASNPSLRFSVSYTTRKPRGNEKPGESYVYITREEFLRRIDRGEFLEYADVFGNYYGTHREVLEQAQAEGKDLILDIDVKGARQLKERIPEAVTIFILPPSRDILEQRLRARSEDAESVIERRLQEAAEELRNYRQYDYVLVNHQVEESTSTLAAIVRAERNRRIRMEEQIRPILKSFEERPPSLFR
ncbi:MAG TPA: guanylate kinase [Bryobacteraceae bacterium]|nr:guanylate kinase [Bryobacteraceae bacterium]